MRQTLSLGFVVLMVLAGVAAADPNPLTDPWLTIDRASGYFGSSGGGEFTIESTPLNNRAYSPLPTQTRDITTTAIAASGSFQSFCVERDEYVSIPQTYQYTVDTFARKGGQGGGNPDPLSAETAWLYTQFAKGTLANYNYGPGSARQSSADALQNAIWALENENWSGADVRTGTWIAAAQAAAADPSVWGNTIGSVRVLNLYHASAITECQSQLYLVPLPGTILLGLLGMGFAGTKLRKLA